MQLERETQAPLPTRVIGKLLNDRGLGWGLKAALLEGHGRPWWRQEQRTQLLESFQWVDLSSIAATARKAQRPEALPSAPSLLQAPAAALQLHTVLTCPDLSEAQLPPAFHPTPVFPMRCPNITHRGRSVSPFLHQPVWKGPPRPCTPLFFG